MLPSVSLAFTGPMLPNPKAVEGFLDGGVVDDDVVGVLEPSWPKPSLLMPIPSLSSSLAVRWCCWCLFWLGVALDGMGETMVGLLSRGVAALLLLSFVLLVGRVSSAFGS